MQETEKEFDLRIKTAERAHDFVRKGAEAHNGQVQAFALAAMKAPAFVSAGGLAAALAFYSANHQLISASAGANQQFSNVLTWLLAALLLTVVAPGLAYFSQLAYLDANSNFTHHYESPYVRYTKRSKIANAIGDICRWTAVIFIVCSIGCAALGGVSLLRLISVLV